MVALVCVIEFGVTELPPCTTSTWLGLNVLPLIALSKVIVNDEPSAAFVSPMTLGPLTKTTLNWPVKASIGTSPGMPLPFWSIR